MDLYFAPLSCSLATRIALYEAGVPAGFHQVTLSTKQLADGSDYLAINPKGQVPALLTPGGVLTEGPAVLQYVADLAPESGLAPAAGSWGRAQLQQWLNYISSEVHKAVFYMSFNPASPPEVRAFARDVLLPARYRHVSNHLEGREFLLEGFSVADAYLFTTLNWAGAINVALADWPVLAAYHARIAVRPAVARAFAEELALR
ncbi:MAG: glutathione S-transferase N-terminal domain-containing protein [Sphingomonadales bacterium]